MSSRRAVPVPVLVRLFGGSAMGVLGLGLMGTNILPFRPLGLLAGVVLLAAGAFGTIGLVTARKMDG
jgi:hypothetical protein